MTPYARRGVHGQTVESLARLVLSGRIAEGATLDLPALQAEFDVSLTVLREALKVLAAKGMVDARQKRGTFVRPRAEWNLLDPDVLGWRFAAPAGQRADTALLHDLGEMRGIVEPAAAGLAARRRDDADLAALDAALTAMGEAGSDPAAAVRADLAFHRALLAAAHNELIAGMVALIEPGLAHRDRIVHSSLRRDPVPGHRAVLDAVRAGDGEAASAAVHTLLEAAGHDLEQAHRAEPADSGPVASPAKDAG